MPDSATDGPSSPSRRLHVVLFSGGRGSGALTRQLVTNEAVDLTVAINGYDDGASTGEVRRFLGDSLGPSDFRKNASTLSRALQACPAALTDLLDLRLPAAVAVQTLAAVLDGDSAPQDPFAASVQSFLSAIADPSRAAVHARLSRFLDEQHTSGKPFDFDDCSVGNLVFAGGYLLHDRRFNTAVDDYCALLGLRQGLIENVTDGTNAFLVATDADGRMLATEEAIVDAARPNRIREIYLVDRPLTLDEIRTIESAGERAGEILKARQPALALNPRLAARIAVADLIIYAPGTQHSSLFPSYLTAGLGDAIAANLQALKVLVTNIQPDAEITGSNAVDLVARAAYYLKNKGRAAIPTPFLITHSLLNDPAHADASRPYVPLGPTDTIEDPRLVRIGNYEDGVTGRHDAARVLEPFVASITARHARRRIAMLLHDDDSLNKITQTLLELVRGGIGDVPVDVTVFYPGATALDARLAARLPFAVEHLPLGARSFAERARPGGYDYVLLFESSGMYRGEETVPLLAQLASGRLDAVWGSRRLSVRDIEESYRFRYHRNLLAGTISYLGSYVLSLACLVLFGRYLTDTLSGVRAIRASDAFDHGVDLAAKHANHVLIAQLLRRKAEILELPVRFVPLSPERVKRTSALDGLRALGILVKHRVVAPGRPAADAAYVPEQTPRTRPAK